MDTLLLSQPASYKQLLKQSLLLYRSSFNGVMLFAFLLAITAFIPRLLSILLGQNIFLNLAPNNPYYFLLIAINFACLMFFIAIQWHMYCVIRQLHEPLMEDFRMGLKKVFHVFIATILQGAIVFAVSMIAYGILILYAENLTSPGHLIETIVIILIFASLSFLILYISTLFIFIIPIIAIENTGIFLALERSISLVWNHWWRTISTQATPWIFYLVVLLAIKFIFNVEIHVYIMNQASYPLFGTFLHLVIFALFIPWVAALLIIQLKDLELRKKLLPQ